MQRSASIWLLLGALAATGCAGDGLQLTPRRSPHFEVVHRHLDLGGTVYLYVDIEGDVEALARGIQDWLSAIPDLKIDMPKIVRALGLDALTAAGLSSVKDGAVFRNKAFLYHRGKREGLLRALGGEPHAFDVPGLAPADVDWAFEQDMHLQQVWTAIEPLIREYAGTETLAALEEKIPELPLSWRGLIGMLDTRLLGVVRLDPTRMTGIPGEEFAVPRIDAWLAADALGGLFDALRPVLTAQPLVKASEDDRLSLLEIAPPLPPGFDWFRPVLAKDKQSGRVYLATHADFLRACLAGKDALASSASFRQATTALPTRGNSMAYTAPPLADKVRQVLERLPSLAPEEKHIMQTLVELLLPTPGVPTASVSTNLADGLLTASNTTGSHKQSLLLAGYTNPAFLGIMSAVAIPTFIRYRERAVGAIPAAPVSGPTAIQGQQN